MQFKIGHRRKTEGFALKKEESIYIYIYNYVTCVLLIPAMVDLKRRKQRHLFVTLFMIWYRNALHAAFQIQIEICFRESAHRNIRKTSGRYLPRHLDLLVIFLSNEFHLPQGIHTSRRGCRKATININKCQRIRKSNNNNNSKNKYKSCRQEYRVSD